GQRRAELAGLVLLADPRQADARGGRVGRLDDLTEVPDEAVSEQRVHGRPVRAGGDRAVLEEDHAGAAAAGVNAEDPAGHVGQLEVPRGSEAWLAHPFTLDAAGTSFVRSEHGSGAADEGG